MDIIDQFAAIKKRMCRRKIVSSAFTQTLYHMSIAARIQRAFKFNTTDARDHSVAVIHKSEAFISCVHRCTSR